MRSILNIVLLSLISLNCMAKVVQFEFANEDIDREPPAGKETLLFVEARKGPHEAKGLAVKLGQPEYDETRSFPLLMPDPTGLYTLSIHCVLYDKASHNFESSNTIKRHLMVPADAVFVPIHVACPLNTLDKPQDPIYFEPY
jgi:hypothetical protein